MDMLTSQLSNLNINDEDMNTFTSLFKNLSLHVTDSDMDALTSNMESLKISNNLIKIIRNDDTIVHITKNELKITKHNVEIYTLKLFLKCGLEYNKPFETSHIIGSY